MTGSPFLRSLPLPSYALQNDADGGRLHPEEPHPYRSPFQRDRDRIIHSKAFRRLGYKTQVFVNSEGDIYRTRLTHSLEVAQISRSVSFALGLNQDFTEALALSHDLGHPPFAHAGQEALNAVMQEHGGFEHNCQGLRQLTKLELRYIGFSGLNLTRASLIGMMKHGRVYECDQDLLPLVEERLRCPPVLEAFLLDFFDRIAYVHHDLEDGLDAEIIAYKDIEEMDWWQESWEAVRRQKKDSFEKSRKAICIRTVIRYMLDSSIQNIIASSQERLNDYSTSKKYPICMNSLFSARISKLQKFLYEKLYRHPYVMDMSKKGERTLEKLFSYFLKSPEKMPEHYRIRIEEDGLHRTVCDYIAGMTDRFAQKEAKE